MSPGASSPGSAPTDVVAVVGGGISGLATAYFLQEEATRLGVPISIVIVEGGERLGGRILSERVDGFVVEAGPDSFLTLKPEAVDLCQRLGLGDSLVGTDPARSKVYVMCGGKLRRLPDGLTSVVPRKLTPFLSTDLLTPRGKARMLLDLVLPRRGDSGDESLADFVERRFGREALERIAEPLMAGIYAGNSSKLSMATNFPQLVQLEQGHRSLILGALSSGRKARPQGTGQGPRPTFMALRGGLELMVEALTSRLGETRILTGSRAVGLRMAEDGYELGLDDGRVVRAQSVVLATPSYESARILKQLNPAAASTLESIPYVSSATVSLAYDASSFPHPLDGTGFVVAPSEGRKITACTWVSSKWPPHSPPGRVLLRCFLGRADHEEVLLCRDAELCEIARDELRSILGVTEKPVLERVYRCDRSLPQYNLGHSDRLFDLKEEMASLPGVFLTGAAYRGVGLPDCIKQGALTAAGVVAMFASRRKGAGELPGIRKSLAQTT